MTIQPIETVYNGYKFRSRLEARYAVFFSRMGIEYEYEPEGFILTGEKYLPDFKITKDGQPFWVEIKPGGCKGAEATRADRLMGKLVGETKTPGLLVFGSPGDELAVLYEPTPADYPAPRLVAIRSLADLCQWAGAELALQAARQARFEYQAELERKAA